MRELLGDSEYGIIVPNSDEAFYDGLKKMLSMSEDQLVFFADKSKERGKVFSTDHLTKSTELYFESIIS